MPAVNLDAEKDVAGHAVRVIYQDFRVALAGAVRLFKRETSRALVDLMTRFTGMDMVPRDEPPAPDVPVIFPSGGGYGLWFDMEGNDPSVVLCCDGPVLGYYETGTAVTPKMATSHTYGCAVAFPGGRVSNSDQPTPPPNGEREGYVGAADGSAGVVFRKAGVPTATDLGQVVVKADAPTDAVKLGGDAAFLGVVRLGDPVAASVDGGALLTAIVAFINGVAPGTIPPTILAAALLQLGQTSGASLKVLSE